MKADYTHISVVLDRSGSMTTVTKATIDGFNEFLAGQKALPGEATLSLLQFDHEQLTTYDFAKLADVPNLSRESYRPRGNTALLDAIGMAIDSLGTKLSQTPEADRPSRIVVVIITDGEENSSSAYSRTKVFELITHQRQKYGWEFMFLGANQDAIQAGASYGIQVNNSLTYNSTVIGTAKAFGTLSGKLNTYRATGKVDDLAFNAQDREDNKDEDEV